MPQDWDIDSIDPATTSPATDITRLTNGLNSLKSKFSGTSLPATNLVGGMVALETTNNVYWRRDPANTKWMLHASAADALVVVKSGAYTAVLGDFEKTLVCTNSWTLGLTAAATLTDGWWVRVVNSGSGTITIDPNASETIGDAATLALAAGDDCIVICDGSGFRTLRHAAIAGSASQVFSTGQMASAAHAVRSDAIVGVMNLRVVAADTANHKLGLYAESTDGVPSASDLITVAVPTVSGIEFRTRSGGFLSGADQITLADAVNYWSKNSLDAEIKTAWVYAIAPAAGGIVWALGGYAGFTSVPTTTTATDDDYLHLEGGSTYTRAATDYCVCIGRVRYQYDTADTPDHTFQTTVLDAPQITYNPRSDYTRTLVLAADNVSGADIVDYSAVSVVVKQSGKYKISGHSKFGIAQVHAVAVARIRTGSATYASATLRAVSNDGVAQYTTDGGLTSIALSTSAYLNAGDTIHLGCAVSATTGSGNRTVYGNADGYTSLTFSRED